MSLTFPFTEAPNRDSQRVVEICPDVLWVRMPLPMSLDHINCYLIKDSESWCIVDTGMPGADTETHWKNIIDDNLAGANISKVIVTHQHMDHVGFAGRLCRKYSAPLFMSKTEYLTVRAFAKSWLDDDEPYWHTQEYFSLSGINPNILTEIAKMREQRKESREKESPLPSSYIRIKDGQILKIGDYEWLAIATAGHSPEHISLFCKELGLYISGDQVLPKITSNVSVMPTEPEANPLQDWIDGLSRIGKMLPASPLVLPSHELPFYGLTERVNSLIEHHNERMDKLLRACESSAKNATELTNILFDRELEPFSLFMATGECLAHLHCLLHKEKITRELKDGIFFYSTSPQ